MCIRDSLLNGEKSAYRDAVLLNAAAAFVIAGRAKDLKEGVKIGQESIDSKSALNKIMELARITETK